MSDNDKEVTLHDKDNNRRTVTLLANGMLYIREDHFDTGDRDSILLPPSEVEMLRKLLVGER